MRTRVVVFGEPSIEIGLQLLDPAVEPFAERHSVELVEQRLVETLADTICLRAPRLSARVVNVLHREVELVLMALGLAAELCTTIGEHMTDHDLVLVEERDDAIVHQVGGGERRLAVVELGERHLGIGVDCRLLVDAPHALQRANVKRVLRHAIARALALKLAMRLLVELGLLERGHLRLGQHHALLRALAIRRLQTLLHGLQIMAQPHAAHAGRRDASALLLSSLATRTWPHAGRSTAISTTAFSIAGSMRFFSIGFLLLISASANSPPFS